MKEKFYQRGDEMKKINEVETIWEFEEFLTELASKNPALFAPLSLHYQLLLQRHKTFIRVMTIFVFFTGFIIGLGLGKLVK